MYVDPGYGRYYTLNTRMGEAAQRDPMQRFMQRTRMGDMQTETNQGYMQRDPMQNQSDPYDIQTNLPEALQLIEDAVQGETEDRLFYQYLISQTRNSEDRNVIAGIRDNEMKHYRMFRQIYQELTGNTIPPQQNIPYRRPGSYCAGIRDALMGEQKAVTRYRQILFAMAERRHINMLTEIITDELRHLGLYNYLYAKNRCTQ